MSTTPRSRFPRHVALLVLLAAAVSPAQVVIDFDALTGMATPYAGIVPAAAVITNQFQPLGVTFSSGGGGIAVLGSSNPVSPPNVGAPTALGPTVAWGNDVTASFWVSGQAAVVDSVSVSLTSSSQATTLDAYDTLGALLGSSTAAASGTMIVSFPGSIASVRLSGNAYAFDDFTFSGLQGLCAAGTVGGAAAPFSPLVADGATALATPAINQSFTVQVAQPPTNPNPANFAVWGISGTPVAGGEYSTPFGDVCFLPAPLAPLNPLLFTVVDTFTPGGPALLHNAVSAPWSFTVPGIPFAITVTLQGVIEHQPGPTNTLAITNAVVIVVQ